MTAEQDIPIDIHSTKLFDWLISRRLCQKDWQQAVIQVREQISHAIQDMPEHPKVVQLLAGTYIDYFKCQQIVDILHETEKDSKNIFGYYSSQRMKDWAEILRLYEVDGLYLAEAAVNLQRLVQYEVPALKKQIARGYTQSEECARKQVDYEKQAKEATRHFQQHCQRLKVDSSGNLRNELISLARDVPDQLSTLAQSCRQLEDPVAYYTEFRRFVVGAKGSTENDGQTEVLPLLNFIMANGNVTVYEFTFGEAPESTEPPAQLHMQTEADANAADDVIDFGDDAGGAAIDFGDFEVAESENGHDEIDFSIETVGDSEDTLLIGDSRSGGSRPKQTAPADRVARGEMALSLLEWPKTQTMFMDDLTELCVFLSQRLAECRQEPSGADLLLASQIARDTDFARLIIDADELSVWYSSVSAVRTRLTDPNTRHLFKIRASERYLEQLTEQLASKRSAIGRYEQLARLMAEKSTGSAADSDALKPQLTQLAERTRQLQKQVEQEISKRYKNRPVNIMGGITAALATT